ncbi:MAG: ABC transporter permease [Thermomicrobiales bacterium]
MSLTRFILRRLLLIVPVLIGVTLLTFSLSHIVPGDPARLVAGPQGTQAMYDELRDEYGLDDPLPVQYWNYLSGLVEGDWGQSILSRRPVLTDLQIYWPATLELVLVAMTFATLIGVPLGVLAAVRADKFADHMSLLVSLLFLSVPAFWLAILMQLLLGLRLDWFPISGRLPAMTSPPPNVTGMYTLDALLHGDVELFLTSLRHIILPAITLCMGALATISRFTSASLLEVLNNDYVRTVRAKGLNERRVIVRHAMRNAFIPTLTTIGLAFGWAMGGAVLVETVFDWPGIGLYATKSALTLDFMPIIGIALLYGIVFSLINIVIDITYGLLDPRVSHS